MYKPNLLIVGAAKSGTTSLHHYLGQHDEVFMSKHKEPHFLINNEEGVNEIPNGINKYEDYLRLFENTKSFKYRGESSVMYLQFPEITIKNIARYLDDDVKIIIMLRNPIDRAFSGYQHVKRYNNMENYTFQEALEKSEKRYFKNKKITPASRYLNIGLYYKFVKKFKSKFKNNVHVIIYDDFVNKTSNELSHLFGFLGLEKNIIDLKEKHMVGGWQWKNQTVKNIFMSKSILKSTLKIILPSKAIREKIRNYFISFVISPVEKIDLETRKKLLNFYIDDIEKLEALINKDLSIWKQ